MKHIKRELRYIRYRICRDIYYADQCPRDCRKDFGAIAKTVGMVLAIAPIAMAIAIILIKLS